MGFTTIEPSLQRSARPGAKPLPNAFTDNADMLLLLAQASPARRTRVTCTQSALVVLETAMAMAATVVYSEANSESDTMAFVVDASTALPRAIACMIPPAFLILLAVAIADWLVPPAVWMPSVTSSSTGRASLCDTRPQPTSSPQEMQEPSLLLLARVAMAALSSLASALSPLTILVVSSTEQLAHPL